MRGRESLNRYWQRKEKENDKEKRDGARRRKKREKGRGESGRERERGKKRTKGTTRGKNERLKERQRDGKRRSKGSTARHAGSMPTNYECKVMVILISSARSAEKKMTVIKPGGNVSPSIVRRRSARAVRLRSVALSVAPAAYIIQNISPIRTLRACGSRVR